MWENTNIVATVAVGWVLMCYLKIQKSPGNAVNIPQNIHNQILFQSVFWVEPIGLGSENFVLIGSRPVSGPRSFYWPKETFDAYCNIIWISLTFHSVFSKNYEFVYKDKRVSLDPWKIYQSDPNPKILIDRVRGRKFLNPMGSSLG